jgi:hypothetical protein
MSTTHARGTIPGRSVDRPRIVKLNEDMGWVSADLKEHFTAAATRHGLSESALLKRLVEQMLAGEDLTAERPRRVARDARVTVRQEASTTGGAAAADTAADCKRTYCIG